MTTDSLIPVPTEEVPRGRGSNPFNEPPTVIAERLYADPGRWFLIGTGDASSRSRLNNAAALLSGSKYKPLAPYYTEGKFETRVSGAKNAPHADQYAIAVYARFVKHGVQYE